MSAVGGGISDETPTSFSNIALEKGFVKFNVRGEAFALRVGAEVAFV